MGSAVIDAIEKAITNSDVGLTPVNDGKIIRLQLARNEHQPPR